MSVPTAGQMLTVIGLAFVAVVILSAGVSVLSDWLTRRTARAINNTAALSSELPAPARATVPAQRDQAAEHAHAA